MSNLVGSVPIVFMVVLAWVWVCRQITPSVPMRRLDRIVLDAIEQLGPDVMVASQIYPYVEARRSTWLFSFGAIHLSLIRLETAGLITSEWVAGPYPRTRLYSKAEE